MRFLCYFEVYVTSGIVMQCIEGRPVVSLGFWMFANVPARRLVAVTAVPYLRGGLRQVSIVEIFKYTS